MDFRSGRLKNVGSGGSGFFRIRNTACGCGLGGGGVEGTHNYKKYQKLINNALYLSPREARLSGLHQRDLVVRHDIARRHPLLNGPLLLQQVPQSFVAFLVL